MGGVGQLRSVAMAWGQERAPARLACAGAQPEAVARVTASLHGSWYVSLRPGCRNVKMYPGAQAPPGILVLRVDAPIYYANVEVSL